MNVSRKLLYAAISAAALSSFPGVLAAQPAESLADCALGLSADGSPVVLIRDDGTTDETILNQRLEACRERLSANLTEPMRERMSAPTPAPAPFTVMFATTNCWRNQGGFLIKVC